MKIVVLGSGRVGAALATLMSAGGCQVSIIDKNREAFKRLGPEFHGTKVGGMGIDSDILKKAGIEGADAFVAVTNGDNTNIMASQIAKEVFHVPLVISRIYDPIREEAYRELGLTTYCSTTIGAKLIKNAIYGKGVTIEEITRMLNNGQ